MAQQQRVAPPKAGKGKSDGPGTFRRMVEQAYPESGRGIQAVDDQPTVTITKIAQIVLGPNGGTLVPICPIPVGASSSQVRWSGQLHD